MGRVAGLNCLAQAHHDDQLTCCLRSLRHIHSAYYTALDSGRSPERTDVLLTRLKLETLRDRALVFSGVVPKDDPRPDRHPLWALAESLGARVEEEVSERTTHVLSPSVHPRTRKVVAALSLPPGVC